MESKMADAVCIKIGYRAAGMLFEFDARCVSLGICGGASSISNLRRLASPVD